MKQDGDPKRTDESKAEELRKKIIQVLQWPSQRPGLKLIKMQWWDFKRPARKHMLLREWMEETDYIKKMITLLLLNVIIQIEFTDFSTHNDTV